jgi:hypothetical protein
MGIDTASYKKLVTPVSIQVPYSPETDNPRRSLAMQITHRLLKELTQAMVKASKKTPVFPCPIAFLAKTHGGKPSQKNTEHQRLQLQLQGEDG